MCGSKASSLPEEVKKWQWPRTQHLACLSLLADNHGILWICWEAMRKKTAMKIRPTLANTSRQSIAVHFPQGAGSTRTSGHFESSPKNRVEAVRNIAVATKHYLPMLGGYDEQVEYRCTTNPTPNIPLQKHLCRSTSKTTLGSSKEMPCTPS